MTKTYKHYHFDHVGSFLRPQTLKEARLAYSEGQLPLSDFKKIQESEIKRLVKEEVNVGLKAVTDGEFNRSWWHLDFRNNFLFITYLFHSHNSTSLFIYISHYITHVFIWNLNFYIHYRFQ